MADSEVRLESNVGVGPGSPCEPEVEVETAAWLESRFVVEPGSPCELEVVAESEAWLEPRVGGGRESPRDPRGDLEMMVAPGA